MGNGANNDSPEAFLGGYLANVAASITTTAINAAGRKFRDTVQGTPVELALQRCTEIGVAAMLATATCDSGDEWHLLHDIFAHFLDQPEVGKELSMLLRGYPLNIDELLFLFEEAGFDHSTLPGVDLNQALGALESAFLSAASGESELADEIQLSQLLEQTRLQHNMESHLAEMVRFWREFREQGIRIQGGLLVANTGSDVFSISAQDEHGYQEHANHLRNAYLNHIFEDARRLSLSGIDPTVASDQSAQLNLDAIYTPLLTLSSKEDYRNNSLYSSDSEGFGDDVESLSAIAQMNQHPRLAFLGSPGSGKSTLTDFMVLCLAGELLGRADANISQISASSSRMLINGSPSDNEPLRDKWLHGALLPIRIVLRDFAAKGMGMEGQPKTADQLWNYLVKELESAAIGEYAPHLHREMLERGALVMFDGLDEVPEAEKRRDQIKEAILDFVATFHRCRVVVTSRPYAYNRQSWGLPGFEAVTLAPFNGEQISYFISRWYRHQEDLRGMDSTKAALQAEVLRRAIFRSDRLRALAERPLLLTLMASLHTWHGGSLPERREELYAVAVELLLDSWERQRVVRNEAGAAVVIQPSLAEWLRVDRQQVRALLDSIAFTAHASQSELIGTADITEEQLVSGLTNLSNNPDVRPQRIVEYLSLRAGLIVPHGIGVFTFPHRTFQEYLSACYLTDDEYPEKLARLATSDPERWREVALLAGAKAARGSTTFLWALAEALCHTDPDSVNSPESEMWGPYLAGQVLIESWSQLTVAPQHVGKINRLVAWHLKILESGTFPGLDRAKAALALDRLGDPRKELVSLADIAICFVPPGPFRPFSQSRFGYSNSRSNSQPTRSVEIGYPYWISKWPVTNVQFEQFIKAGGYSEERYWPEAVEKGHWSSKGVLDHTWPTRRRREGESEALWRTLPARDGDSRHILSEPVTGICWYEAMAFCRWLTEHLRDCMLIPADWTVVPPTWMEWQKAARGGDRIPVEPHVISLGQFPSVIPEVAQVKNRSPKRHYPWGRSSNVELANCIELGIGEKTVPGVFPHSASPYGVEDMIGNVYEWSRSSNTRRWLEQSDHLGRGRSSVSSKSKQEEVVTRQEIVVVGSSYSDRLASRLAFESKSASPDQHSDAFGLRLALVPESFSAVSIEVYDDDPLPPENQERP